MSAPTALTSLVGRRRELATLRRLLRTTRLLTLTGPGGCGKTRLAMELARSAKQQRVVWIDLAPMRDGSQIAPLVRHAVGARHDRPLDSDSLAAALGTDSVLIVLDNCEHVLAPASDVASRLLRGANNTTVLATSREPLRMNGEMLWRVPGLAVPSAEEAKDPARCGRSDAVHLFIERARLVRHDFSLDPVTSARVAGLCRSLAGMPLALELAAGRLRNLSLATLAEQLERPLALLAGQEGDPDPRHRSLRATLDWSHALLDERERLVFRRLAVFADSFSAEAASALCADKCIPVADVTQLIANLVDKSLVEVSLTEPRYELLEPIREYAMEQLRSKGEEDLAFARLAGHLTRLLDEELPLDGGPRTTSSGARARIEFFNVAAVVPWLMRNDPRTAVALLARFAILYWTMVPIHVGSVGGWLDAALAAHRQPDGTRAIGLVALARIRADISDLEAARRAAAEAIEVADQVPSVSLKARASFGAAVVAAMSGEIEDARAQLDQVIPELRQLEPELLARALDVRAILRSQVEDHAGAEADLRDAAAAWDRYADRSSSMRFQTFMCGGEVAFTRGDVVLAIERIRQAISCQRDSDGQQAGPFEMLAHIMARQGRSEYALRLAGFAERRRDEAGIWLASFFTLADRAWLSKLERGLGDRARVLRAQGRRMTTADAVRYALGEEPGALTKRERAIAILIGEGLSDRDIAARLVISERTAENHVRHIREKLAIRSRAQIGRWVAEHASVQTRNEHFPG